MELNIEFRCNICGADNVTPARDFHRELAPCGACGSNVRFRGLMHALAIGLFGRSTALPDFPEASFRGVGMSDARQYAEPLAMKLAYSNTFYHCEPRLDIIEQASIERWQGLDFVISSDVLEHVPPPVQTAFDNVLTLLKPGGLFVFSVPYTDAAETIEHFSDLHHYEILPFQGSYILVNRRADGQLWVRDDLIFHGGPGSTLEMRLYGQGPLMKHLEAAGFQDIKVYDEPIPEIGYYWPSHEERPGCGRSLSYVMTARRPV